VTRIALALVLTAAAAAPAALAQQKEQTHPWRAMTGRNAGAVGTCVTEAGALAGCYLVRCDPARGLVFVVQDDIVESFGVKSYRFVVGKQFDAVYPVARAGKDEAVITLADKPDFLTALRGRRPWMQMFTAQAKNSYSTGFTLLNAGKMIAQAERRCGKR
jgi:hypothetical protein